MAKYSFEFKKQIVKEYLEGNGGYKYLACKYNVSSYNNVKKWIMNYQQFGDQGLLRSRQSQNYTYKGKVGTVAPNRIHRRFHTHILHQKIATDTTEFKYYEVDAKGHMTMQKLYLDPFMDIENLSKDEREKLKRKVLEQCHILEENNITNKVINTTRKEEVIQDKYFKLKMPCVFLDEENSCSIYKVRPSLCWSYRNYGDKADCEKDYDVESTIKYDDWEHRVFERILTARPPRNGLYVLPFAIKEMMEW